MRTRSPTLAATCLPTTRTDILPAVMYQFTASPDKAFPESLLLILDKARKEFSLMQLRGSKSNLPPRGQEIRRMCVVERLPRLLSLDSLLTSSVENLKIL